MFCLYCTNYKSLEEPCKQGIKMTDIDKIMKCQHYKYNKGVKTQ